MCHADTPAGPSVPGVVRADITLTLPGGGQMPASLQQPEGGARASVLVVHDIFGPTPFYQGLCARLAGAGYRVLLPEMFFREGPLDALTREAAYARWRRFDERRALGELHVALDWLAAQGGASAGRLGTMGFCLGGTLVLDLTADRRDLATVCYYGFPAAGAHTHPWSVPAPLDLIDKLHGPILGLWGDQDATVGVPNVLRLRDDLAARQVDFECVIYPGVGHAFMGAPIFEPTTATEAAAADAWSRTLAFYARQLSPASGR